ncbi:MAG TPA: glucose-6-phosphate dehydrogenase assembly protein OpcA, partial [Candidatus Limnocylindrales bacterium]
MVESGGGTRLEAPAAVGQPILRWSSKTRSIDGIEAELARIWAGAPLATEGEGGELERHVAARTSVMNLVVIARRPEIGEHAVAIIRMLAGRHPSRTLVVSSADPDGPSWLDARIQAVCVVPRGDAAETCTEFIDLVAGGESGRHLAAIVAPLLV